MASSKRSQSSSSNQVKVNVDGYVQDMTFCELKIPQTGNRASRYFDFKVQEREEIKRVICFSPNKRPIEGERKCKNSSDTHELSPQKRKYQLDQTEYKMNQYSNIVVNSGKFCLTSWGEAVTIKI